MEFGNAASLDGYMNYFYQETVSFLELFDMKDTVFFLDEPAHIEEHAKAVETEFRESMIHRAEKGYILPGQMNLLFSLEETAARLSRGHVAYLSALDMKNSFTGKLLKPSLKSDMTVKSISSYNNSFESLVQDLKRYKKISTGFCCYPPRGQGAERLARDLQDAELTAFYSGIRNGSSSRGNHDLLWPRAPGL